MAHAIFIFAQASVVAMKLNERRAVFLKASGYDLTLSSGMFDKAAWRISLSGGTLRDFLKTRRPPSKL